MSQSEAEARGRARARRDLEQGIRDIEQERAFILKSPGFVGDRVAACDAALEQLRKALS